MNSASIHEVPAAAVKKIIGRGYSIRASNGEAIVNVLAKKLQYPNEEAANMTATLGLRTYYLQEIYNLQNSTIAYVISIID